MNRPRLPRLTPATLLSDLRRLRFSRQRPRLALAAMLLGSALGAPAAEVVSPAASAPPATQQALALQRASDAVLGVEVHALDGAYSNDTLGRWRTGSGVVIGDDGLVLTIGYLLLEAEEASLLLDNGRRVPARVVGVDIASGFGLLQSLLPLPITPAPLARQTDVGRGESLMLVSGGSEGAISMATLSTRSAFSGYWEYHLDQALFTRPARTDHSGASLFNARGELLGIGSLLVLDTPGEHEAGPGNMFVPIDLLPPVIAELRERGSSRASHRAWLGVNCQEQPDGVRVVRVNRDSPAESAGLQAGDLIVAIDDVPVRKLESFYKRLWSGGPERDVRLAIVRDGQALQVRVQSIDRMRMLRRARSI